MCHKVWNPNPRTTAENLALLEGRVASPLDRAALDVLTEMAAAERARFAGRPVCDWCDSPAAMLVCDDEGSEDFACTADFTRWFAPAIAAGESFEIRTIDSHTVTHADGTACTGDSCGDCADLSAELALPDAPTLV